MIERSFKKIQVHPLLKEICASGIPDIRVIICKGVPVMVMIRLPTLTSRGRANLHQGAVGCGLNMKPGTITNAIHQNKIIEEHLDTHFLLHHMKLPFWEKSVRNSIKMLRHDRTWLYRHRHCFRSSKRTATT